MWNMTVVSMHQISPAISFKNTALCTHYQHDQINDSMHRSCSTHGGKKEMPIKFWSENLKETIPL